MILLAERYLYYAVLLEEFIFTDYFAIPGTTEAEA